MITEGYLVRHDHGAAGGRDAALLDVAQDHLLTHLHSAGLFDRGLVFTGGTARRKFRAGNLGRLSADLDFSAPDEALRWMSCPLSTAPGSSASGSRWTVSATTGAAERLAPVVLPDPPAVRLRAA